MKYSVLVFTILILLVSASPVYAGDYGCFDLPLEITSRGNYIINPGPTCTFDPNDDDVISVGSDSVAFIVVKSNHVVIDCSNRKIKSESFYDDSGLSSVFIANEGGRNLTIRNCDIEGFSRAIYYPFQEEITNYGSIHDNIFRNNVRAIRIEKTNNVTIRNNEFYDNYRSIIVWPKETEGGTTPHLIKSNKIVTTKLVTDAVDLTYCNQWCSVINGYSIWVDQAKDVELRDNIIREEYASSDRIQTLIQNTNSIKLNNNTISSLSTIKKSIRLNNAAVTGLLDTVYETIAIAGNDQTTSYTIKWATRFKVSVDSVPIKNADVDLQWNSEKSTGTNGLTSFYTVLVEEGEKENVINYNPFTVTIDPNLLGYESYATTANIPDDMESDIIEINLPALSGNGNPPTVTLTSPTNRQAGVYEGDIEFICDVIDDNNISMVAFFWNESGSMEADGVEYFLEETNQETVTFAKTGVSPGLYEWNCKAFDQSYQSAMADSVFILDVIDLPDVLSDSDRDGFYREVDDCDDDDDEINPDATEVCNSKDDDCNSVIDDVSEEECGTSDEGECSKGTGSCVNGELVCEGVVNPTPEICDNKDNDCDGDIDEDETGNDVCCGIIGATEQCGLDNYPERDGIGICSLGTKECTQYGWTECEGDQGPLPETCNGVDDDCNTLVDEGCPSLPSCHDGIRNGNEQDVDCGGDCLPCSSIIFPEIDLMLIAAIIVVVIIAILAFFILKSTKKEEDVSWSDLKDRWSQ